MARAADAPPTLAAFALVAEVSAAVLIFAPTASLLAPRGTPTHLVSAAVLLAVVAGATALWRLVVPGPKAAALLGRPGGVPALRALYYGILAGILLVFYRAAWVVVLHFKGTAMAVTLGGGAPSLSPFAAGATLLAALAGAYLFFGYVQGTTAAAFGRRAALVVAAVLAAATASWPLDGGASRVGEYGPWLVFAAWRLPEALALAYLTDRCGNVAAPAAAVVLLAWVTALGRALFSFLGSWPFLFGVVILLLVSAEILIGERRRWIRAAGGFFPFLLGGGEGASLLDAALITGAAAGVFALARAADVITRPPYVSWPVAGALAVGAAALA